MNDRRLEEIADRLEIDDLLTRYATAVDRKDWDLYASCFTPDATIDYTSAGGVKGRLPEVVRWLSETLARFPVTQHLVTNRDIRIDGDRATSRSGFYNPMGLPSRSGAGVRLFFEGGYYEDRLVRTREGWRIEERIEESVYSTLRQPVFRTEG